MEAEKTRPIINTINTTRLERILDAETTSETRIMRRLRAANIYSLNVFRSVEHYRSREGQI